MRNQSRTKKKPTAQEIDNAKEYIRRRLAAENSMEHYLDRKLLLAAKALVSLAVKHNIPPTLFSFNYDPLIALEANRIINTLTDEIEEYDFIMATQTDKADKDTLLPYINREINGISYRQRLETYTFGFKLEIQDIIKVGLLANMTQKALVQTVTALYKRPYTSKLTSHLEHRGQATYARLLTLTRHTIADTWMFADMESARKGGALGFIPFRGSNYPCEVCSDHAGRFHDFSEPYPPFHPHCVCFAVPIY